MKRRLLLIAGLSIGAASPGLVGRALAGQCPAGQILRVSKNICVDRGEAEKLGIVRSVGIKASAAPPSEAPAAQDSAGPAVDGADAPQTAKPVRVAHARKPLRQPEVDSVSGTQESAAGADESAKPKRLENAAMRNEADREVRPSATAPYGALNLNGFSAR